jgi:hypothetical protein
VVLLETKLYRLDLFVNPNCFSLFVKHIFFLQILTCQYQLDPSRRLGHQ